MCAVYLWYLETTHTVRNHIRKRTEEWRRTTTDRTERRKKKFHMSCIAYLSHIVAYVAKLKRNACWEKKKKENTKNTNSYSNENGMNIFFFFSVTRYLFFRGACVWHWQQTVQVASHTPKGKNATWDFCCMQNESISKMLPICCRCLCFW